MTQQSTVEERFKDKFINKKTGDFAWNARYNPGEVFAFIKSEIQLAEQKAREDERLKCLNELHRFEEDEITPG